MCVTYENLSDDHNFTSLSSALQTVGNATELRVEISTPQSHNLPSFGGVGGKVKFALEKQNILTTTDQSFID
jgi:hypothetical protein